MNAVMPQLTPEVAKRLNMIKLRYLQFYGEEGLYERVNNRTVSRILAEYSGDDPTPIASGQIDDIRYELFEAPEAGKETGEKRKGKKRGRGKTRGGGLGDSSCN